MKLVLRSDYQGHMPERLSLPASNLCINGHRLLTDSNEPTSNLHWDYSTGNPVCAACTASDARLSHAVLDRQHGSKQIMQCKQGHPVTDTSHELRAVVHDGRVDVQAVCKRCKPISKAIERTRAPILALPTGPRPVQRQPVVPQAQLKDLRVAMGVSKVLGLFHGNRVADNVTAISRRVPTNLNSGYSYRSRELGRATARGPEINIDRVLQNSSNGMCHHCSEPFKNGQPVSFDHYIPLRAGGWHGHDNLRLIHRNCNYQRGDKVPNAQEAEAHGMGHLAPIVRILNPLNRSYRASSVPLSFEHPDEHHATFGEVTGHRSGRWTHYVIPGLNQHSPNFSEIVKDDQGKAVGRHPAINAWLNAALVDKTGKRLTGIPGWNRENLAHNVFVRDERGVPYLHPALKAHLLKQLPPEYRQHFDLLKGFGGLWLRKVHNGGDI
jgi:hypothetical protein